MKALSEIQLPADLKYTGEHVWVKTDANEVVLGISDFAQDQLGEVVFVDLPTVGDHIAAGDGFGTVESIKSVNTLFMPVSGEISAVNDALENTPTLVNAGCYDRGWMLRIKPDNKDDLTALLSAEAYHAELAK